MTQLFNPKIQAQTLRVRLQNTETSILLPSNIQSADIQSINLGANNSDNSYGVQYEFYFNSGEPKNGNRNTIFQGSGLNIPLSGRGNSNLYFIANNATSTSYLDITFYLYA